jgi:single-strand DNA-binding protein
MFDTYVTIIGTVLNTPERRRLDKTDAVVTTFRVASHPRRYDRTNGQWVDAPNLRIKVTCWRRLAEGVAESLVVGDPVVVYGRITSRDWTNEQGEPRLSYEVEADVVGHDLSRGQAKFQRRRAAPVGTVVEDAEAENRVNGEVAHLVEGGSLPTSSDLDGPDTEALSILRQAGLVSGDDVATDGTGTLSAGATPGGSGGDSAEPGDGDASGDGEDESIGDDAGGSGNRGRRRGRQPVPA